MPRMCSAGTGYRMPPPTVTATEAPTSGSVTEETLWPGSTGTANAYTWRTGAVHTAPHIWCVRLATARSEDAALFQSGTVSVYGICSPLAYVMVPDAGTQPVW